MTEDTRARDQMAIKARLFDEFPPSEDAIMVKLEALALVVNIAHQLIEQAELDVRVAGIDELDAAIRSLESATKHYHEQLREFTEMYALIRQNVDGADLLNSWRDYVRRYEEKVMKKRSRQTTQRTNAKSAS